MVSTRTRICSPRRARPGGAGSPAAARGSIGVGMVAGMVVVQLIMVAVVISGARDQDVTLQRVDGARAFYACEAGSSMAIREIMTNTDADGSGAVGAVSTKTIMLGATVSVAVSGGSPITLTSTGSIRDCTSKANVAIGSGGGTNTIAPFTGYALGTTPTIPSSRVYASGSWGSAINTSAGTGTVAWMEAVNCPVGIADPRRAVVSLCQDASLWISQHAGGVWGGATALTTGTGTTATPAFSAEYEHGTGNLMVVYRKGTNSSVYYRTYTSASPSEQSFSIGFGSAPTRMALAQKPRSSELVLIASAGSRLCAAVWNGSSWGNTVTLTSSSLPTSGRPFHAAYMNASGHAMVVWTNTSGSPQYRTWNGTSWSSASTLPSISGSVQAGWIKLAGSPLSTSNDLLVAIIGSNSRINVNNWNGSSWGSNLAVETSGAASTEPRVDVCFQPDGLAGLVSWYRTGQTSLLYRTWNGSSWSSQQTGPNMETQTYSLRLERGQNPTEIMMLARRSRGGWADYHAYSQTGTISSSGSALTPPTGSNVPGVTLPPPPAGASNSNHITRSSGTLTPGTYGDFNVSGTVGFTAGTYIFNSVTVASSTTLNFDSSGGEVTWIVTNGNLLGTNNARFVNTGTGPVVIHVVNGNFQFQDDTELTNLDLFVYNGNVQFDDDADGTANIYAKANIQMDQYCTIDINPYSVAYSMPCSAVLWTGGAPGARVDLANAMAPSGSTDPLALGASPIPSSSVVTSWAAVAP